MEQSEKSIILGAILTKMMSGGVLTTEEKAILAGAADTLQKATKTAKENKAVLAEQKRKEEEEEHHATFTAFYESAKKSFQATDFKSADDLKKWLLTTAKVVPTLKRKRNNSTTDWLTPIDVETVKPDSYNGLILASLKEGPKTKAQLVKVLKDAGKDGGKAGLMYRVNMAINGKIPGCSYNEKTKMVTYTPVK